MSRKCRFLNNLTSNHVVTTAVDSKGVTERVVTAHSAGLKVLRFDTDPWTAVFLDNSTDFSHLRGPFGKGIRNARQSLHTILL